VREAGRAAAYRAAAAEIGVLELLGAVAPVHWS
jgi:hypothetical protein